MVDASSFRRSLRKINAKVNWALGIEKGAAKETGDDGTMCFLEDSAMSAPDFIHSFFHQKTDTGAPVTERFSSE